MAIRINEDSMTLEIDGHVVATARFSKDAAADSSGHDRARRGGRRRGAAIIS